MANVEMHTTAGGDGKGFASGWNVLWSELQRRWVWSAYGPRGGSQGLAASRVVAEHRAQKAERDLRHPLHG